jgi:hypothetical protein
MLRSLSEEIASIKILYFLAIAKFLHTAVTCMPHAFAYILIKFLKLFKLFKFLKKILKFLKFLKFFKFFKFLNCYICYKVQYLSKDNLSEGSL